MDLRVSYELDFVYRVDRSVSFTFPSVDHFESFSKFDRPDLQCSGPTEYNLKEVEQWRHPKQKDNWCVTGITIYNSLKQGGGLERALNLQDANGIMSQGGYYRYEVFRSVFRDTAYNIKTPVFWGSVAEILFDQRPLSAAHGSFLVVPYLYMLQNGDLDLRLKDLREPFGSLSPALLFEV